MSRNILKVAVLAVLLWSSHAFARDPLLEDPEPDLLAEEGEGRAVQADRPLFDDARSSDRSVSRLERELAERAPRTLPEALWDLPGAFVVHSDHSGGAPVIRGMTGPRNLILVDGVRLNNAAYRHGPAPYLNLIDPHATSRIELLRGPGSVLHGGDALGGVVQIIPLTARDFREELDPNYGGRVTLRYGSADTARSAHGHLETGYRGLGLLGGMTLGLFDELSGGGDTGPQLNGGGYEHDSAVANVTYRFSRGLLEGWQLKTVYLMSRVRADSIDDGVMPERTDTSDDLVFTRLLMKLPRIRTAGDVTLSYQRFFERAETTWMEPQVSTPERSIRDEVTVHTMGLDLALSTRLLADTLRFRYGGLWYRDWLLSDQWSRAGSARWEAASLSLFPRGSTYDIFGGFLFIEGDLLTTQEGQALRVAGGYRLHGMAGDAPGQETLSGVSYIHFGHLFSGSLLYRYLDRAAVALTYSQAFRAPNLSEGSMLGNSGVFFQVPNYELRPERTDTLELLARGRVWRLSATFSSYISILRDLLKREQSSWNLQTELGGKPVVRSVNGGSGLLWGVEARLAASLPSDLTLSGSVTFAKGDEHVANDHDVPLTRVPPLFGRLSLRYDVRGTSAWRAFAEVYLRWAARQARLSEEDLLDARIPPDGTPGWLTMNLRAGFTYRRLSLGLAVENILDEAFRYHGSAIYGPGASAVLFLDAMF
jgi:outer membrane receptor protein involved in Fe transport